MSSVSGPLERAGQLAFVMMCLSVTAVAGHYLVRELTGAAGESVQSVSDATSTAPGGRIALQPPLRSGARAIVVLVLSTRCKYCTDSAPFYRRLTALATNREALQIAVVSIQDVPVMREYLAQHQVSINEVVRLGTFDVRVTATPTLLLTDGEGVVRARWTGLLNESQEQEVLATIGGLAGDPD